VKFDEGWLAQQAGCVMTPIFLVEGHTQLTVRCACLLLGWLFSGGCFKELVQLCQDSRAVWLVCVCVRLPTCTTFLLSTIEFTRSTAQWARR
jgi:hypothetical protein